MALLLMPGEPPALCGEPSTPTPTPRSLPGEQRLTDYAKTIELDRSRLDADGDIPEITNDTVDTVGRDGLITTTSPAPGGGAASTGETVPTPTRVDATRRPYWRTRVLSQARRVEQCAAELQLAEAKIDSLEDAAFDRGSKGARLWARVDEAKRRLEVVKARCTRERAELSSIVRAARKEGAQPGWFR